MKSRKDFKTKKQYKTYLKHYYSGLALQGILAKKFDENGEYLTVTVSDTMEYADRLIEKLF